MSEQLPEAELFIQVIRDAVAADPGNIGLRADLIELLLVEDLDAAQREIDEYEAYGAPAGSVLRLRARHAAARLRQASAGPSADESGQSAASGQPRSAPSADSPGQHPPASSPAAPPASSPASMPPLPATPPSTPLASPPSAATQQPFHHPQTPQPPAGRQPIRANDDEEGGFDFDLERPTVRLHDVAGMHEVKNHIETSFFAPLRNPALARAFGQSPRGSLLMYGPPGTGKTFIARAIAGELGAGFVHLTLAELMNQYFGQSEKAIRQAFELARSNRPCVIFFDEFDAIGGRRSSHGSSSQYLRMVVGQLLVELDGVDAANDGIYVLAATNRPWDIDPALRRPGRLDRTVLILPPDAAAREAILINGLQGKPVAPGLDLRRIVARTEGYSGADLAYLVNTAVQRAFAASIQQGSPSPITAADLDQAAQTITPSTRSWFEQVKPVLEYGVDDGTFGQLRSYLKQHRI